VTDIAPGKIVGVVSNHLSERDFFDLGGLLILGWVVRGAVPHIFDAFVKDRADKRHHERKMEKFNAGLECRRTRKKRKNDDDIQRERTRGDGVGR
jgi:hypothetical protein